MTNAEARIATIKKQFMVNYQPKEEDVVKKDEETPTESSLGRNIGNSTVTCQEQGSKHKEPCLYLGSLKADTKMRYVHDDTVSMPVYQKFS